MRSATGLLAIPFLTLVASADTPPRAPDPQKLSDKAALLAPIQVDSLTLTPIVSTAGAAKEELVVLTLDEAFAQKQVSIREKEDESVNALTLTNTSNQPLFMLAGEVIIGGKQDRIIGANTVIPAKSTQAVPVYCVEHGRWQGNNKEFTSGKALAHGRLRGRASYAAQGEVWAEVAQKNEMRKTTNPTDTYRKVATQQSDGTLAKQEKAVNEALGKVPAADRGRMIGYVVSLNGKVSTVDMFQSPGLFRKLEPKLVRSYLTEAVDIAATKDAAKAPTAKDVQQFIADAAKAKEERSYENAYSGTMVQKGTGSDRATVRLKAAPRKAGDSPAAATPAAEPTVYENVQAK